VGVFINDKDMTTKVRLLKTPLAGTRDAAACEAKSLDAHQFIQLYDEYFGRVYRYARYRLTDHVVAEDMTALTFERALNCLEDFDPLRGTFGSWLFTIARNLINNHLRDEKKRACLSLENCAEQPDKTASPEEKYLQVEAQSELIAAMTCLSERDRDLLSLKFAASLTNRRIAEITGLSENNVGVILFRALHKLRNLIDENSV
jgi:RNA polymerase sigma factor (sigma-70 family)